VVSTAISRGEQNRYGWRRRTLLTAWLADKILAAACRLRLNEVYGGGYWGSRVDGV